jgi:hypothetical protein
MKFIYETVYLSENLKKNFSVYKNFLTKNFVVANAYNAPMVKHWNTSIYKYNKNIQLHPIKNKIVNKLISSYVNLFFFKYKWLKFAKKYYNNIYVSMPLIKHSNSKTIIIIFVYNYKKNLLLQQYYSIIPYWIRTTKYKLRKKLKINFLKKQRKNLENKNLLLNKIKYNIYKLLKNQKIKIFIKNKFKNFQLIHESKKINLFYKNFNNLKRYIFFYLPQIFTRLSKKININLFKLKINLLKKNYFIYLNEKKIFNKLYLYLDLLTYKIENLIIYRKTKNFIPIWLNNYKFVTKNILNLKYILSKIYKNEIEIKIINLNYIFLESFILSKSLTKRMRKMTINDKIKKTNKKKPRWVFARAFYYARKGTSFIKTKLLKKYKKKLKFYFIKNKIKNNKKLIRTGFWIKNILYKNIHINKYILYILKQKKITGIKMIASGRLTRRYVASRAISYYEKEGNNLKNTVTSQLNIKNKLVRGTKPSNAQYTKVTNFNRIGAYGLKTWIASD